LTAVVVGAASTMVMATPALGASVAPFASPPTPIAHAAVVDATGAGAGSVSFRQEGDRVRVRVRATGLSAGFHGFHVHTVGDCTVGNPASPFTAAGGHLNIGGQTHGVSNPVDPGGHDGDMPVLFANGAGVAETTFLTDNFTIAEILDTAGDGSAVIIHALPDNYANIPSRYTAAGVPGPDAATASTGDSGTRQRCGLVQTGPAEFGSGYWFTASDGGVFAFGSAGFQGSTGGLPLAAPVVGMAAAPSRAGYWLAAEDGGVFAFNAPFYGSGRQLHLLSPIVGLAASPGDAGARLTDAAGAPKGSVSFAETAGGRLRVNVAATGLSPGWHGMHVHTKGDCTVGDPAAPFTGAGGHLNGGGQSHGIAPAETDPSGHDGDLPLLYADASGTATAQFVTDNFTLAQLLDADRSAVIVHAGSDNYGNIPNRYSSGTVPGADATTAATGDAGTRARCGAVEATGGYLLADKVGSVFPFGRAPMLLGRGGGPLNSPIVGIVASPSGLGAWLVASDGGVFTDGDAQFFGSTGALHLNKPIVGMAGTPTGLGYWLVASDGGIFAYGDARFFGSTGGAPLNQPVTGMIASAGGGGYHLVAMDGGIFSFGDAEFAGSTGALTLNRPIIAGGLQG